MKREPTDYTLNIKLPREYKKKLNTYKSVTGEPISKMIRRVIDDELSSTLSDIEATIRQRIEELDISDVI